MSFFKTLKRRIFGEDVKKSAKPPVARGPRRVILPRQTKAVDQPARGITPAARVAPQKEAPTSAAPLAAAPAAEPSVRAKPARRPAADSKPPETRKAAGSKRDPYFIQIGFDFGTSCSKCVCRDVLKEKAWVHIPSTTKNSELPFLIPSALSFDKNRLSHCRKPGTQYAEHGLPHLKLAIERIACSDWKAPVLEPYWKASGATTENKLCRFIRACGGYLLAGALGEVRKDIRQRFPDFGAVEGDYEAVNLAVPVADAQRPAVNAAYQSILEDAWRLAPDLAGHPSISLEQLQTLIDSRDGTHAAAAKACLIYPEVSANVQGFVRSRVSQPGIYLFSDTGAGTVDQSVFIFVRRDGAEHLTYLHGSVLPLGSSSIEIAAARSSGDVGWRSLEKWRERKERGVVSKELDRARSAIEEDLAQDTLATLVVAKRKLIVREQLNKIVLIFGGGGHCGRPYTRGVVRAFSGPFFRHALTPDEIGVPTPKDISLKSSERKWMQRLSVAYGLSFDQTQLASFTYPRDVEPPSPDAIWRPTRRQVHAVDKDEC